MKYASVVGLALLSLLVSGLLVSPARGQGPMPKLPFRVKPDGSANLKDLMELAKRPTASDRITDEELEKIKARHKINYGPEFAPTQGPKMPPRGDLYKDSVLISDGMNHTLVPKKAVIWIPDTQKSRIVEKPVGRLILWPDFVKDHSTWLRAYEIPFDTATGKTPLTEDQWEAVKLGNAIVVSVMNTSPISMLEPEKAPEAAIAVTSPPDGKAMPKIAANEKPETESESTEDSEDKAAAAGAKTTPATAGKFDFSGRFKPRTTR